MILRFMLYMFYMQDSRELLHLSVIEVLSNEGLVFFTSSILTDMLQVLELTRFVHTLRKANAYILNYCNIAI